MKSGIICLGEALIDFIPLDSSNLTYQKSPGGAPANVAVGVARLGIPSAFLGKVGKDVLGMFLKKTLTNYGVQTDSMVFTERVRTGAVFVTLADNGERSFDFYIDPSADRFLEASEISESLFERNKILHFGSISLISEPSRSATKKAVEYAQKNGMIISYDPNLRLGLWENEEVARKMIVSMLGEADVLKISEEELAFLTGEKDVVKGVQQLKQYQIPVILVTLGSEGSYCFVNGDYAKVQAMKVEAVDTTGAGDAFVSGFLYSLHEFTKDIASLTLPEAVMMAEFASVSGGLAASTKGAMTALPTLEEVHQYLKNNS